MEGDKKFSDDILKKNLAFRGGTALHKLFLKTPLRYPENIDLVQIKSEPIGNFIDRLRETILSRQAPESIKRNLTIRLSSGMNRKFLGYFHETAEVLNLCIATKKNRAKDVLARFVSGLEYLPLFFSSPGKFSFSSKKPFSLVPVVCVTCAYASFCRSHFFERVLFHHNIRVLPQHGFDIGSFISAAK